MTSKIHHKNGLEPTEVTPEFKLDCEMIKQVARHRPLPDTLEKVREEVILAVSKCVRYGDDATALKICAIGVAVFEAYLSDLINLSL